MNAELEERSNMFVAGDAACFFDPVKQIPMLQEWHINADLHHPRAEAWHLAGTAPTITADVLQQVPTWPRRLDEHSAAGHFV